MSFADILSIAQWWVMFLIIGIIFLPITYKIFSSFFDKGYIFSKIIGIIFISYIAFLVGILKILPFTFLTINLVIIAFFALNIFIFVKVQPLQRLNLRASWRIFVFEEILFFTTLFFWSFIRSHQPDIHGLEKYMDFGFINSILRSEYFPPSDMWFTPLPINYYYFGHLVTGVLTKLSSIPSAITYNLMLSTIFAFTFTAAFSIGANLICLISNTKIRNSKQRDSGVLWTSQSPQNDVILASKRSLRVQNPFRISIFGFRILIGGLLTAFIVSLAGNLHTIYLFFKPYVNENPVPFWQLAFSPNTFPNGYWYPNATRFIQNTIHEFPIYSAVVSDLHGHYLDVPFVLLTLAILFSILLRPKLSTLNFQLSILLAFLLAIMYMTNAWDGIIYFLLTALLVLYVIFKPNNYPVSKEIKNEKLKIKNSFQIENFKLKILNWFVCLLILGVGFFIFTLPFNLNFKPFASGIGILCAPEFLTNIGKLGPFLFEKGHCQHSPWWQLLILYGFFYFWALSFFILFYKAGRKIQNSKFKIQNHSSKLKIFNFRLQLFTFNFSLLTRSDIFILILILFSTFLIIIPEFIYVKDIYPAHYRANTMFKLVYQSFIMLSIASAYIMIRVIPEAIRKLRARMPNIFNFYFVFFIFSILFFILVMIYPYFAINSYYGDLKKYRGLDGIKYLKTLYPSDYEAVLWINKNIKGQPVILEAQGDSYTDYGRISTNTGLPTVLGWTVHEWLWRGSYDIPSPRIEEVKKMYESQDLEETKTLLKKYNVKLVFMGSLEKEKYPNLNEQKFESLGKIIYQNGDTKIYKIN